MDANLAASGSSVIATVKNFFAQNKNISDYAGVIKELDQDNKIRGAVRQINPRHIRVAVATLAMQELVRQLWLLTHLYSNTPAFRQLYIAARTIKDRYRSNFLNMAVDTNMDIMSTFQEFAGGKGNGNGNASPPPAAAAAAAATPPPPPRAVDYDSDFDYECDAKYNKQPQSDTNKIFQNTDADEEDYDYLEDFENDAGLSDDEKAVKRRLREDKELMLDHQLKDFLDWVTCFYNELNKPELLDKLKNRDETLFTHSGLSWLTPKRFMSKVDSQLDPDSYPHDAEQALEEMKILDEDRAEDKKRLPRTWNHLSNLMLMAQFLVTVEEKVIGELLDNLNTFIDQFLEGQIKDFAQIQEKLMDEINRKLPEMKAIAMQLKDLILATVFHNLDKFRKQLKQMNAKFGTQIAQWSAELGVPIDLDRFEHIFENNVVQKIVSLHTGQPLENAAAAAAAAAAGGVGQETSLVVATGAGEATSPFRAMTGEQIQEMARQYAKNMAKQ